MAHIGTHSSAAPVSGDEAISDGRLQVSLFEARCPHCRANNLVTIKRSHHSGWNDPTVYSCASCGHPIGTKSAFCVETAKAA